MTAPAPAKQILHSSPLLNGLLQSITHVAEKKNEMWQRRKIFSNFLRASVSSSVKSEGYITSQRVLPCLTCHESYVLNSLLNMVKEEYDLTRPLTFLVSKHFFSLQTVTLRDDFSVFSCSKQAHTGYWPVLYLCPQALLLNSCQSPLLRAWENWSSGCKNQEYLHLNAGHR